MAQKTTEVARPDEKGLARKEAPGTLSMFDRFAREMDRLFDDFGFGRAWPTSRLGFDWPRLSRESERWLPELEMLERNGELVIRADLPGLTKDDIKVDVTEDAVTIQGERKREHEEEKEGVYRSERSYGSFYRTIALPEGAIADQAKATFKDGVLEIAMPAPPASVNKGRRLEIADGAAQKK